MRKCTGIEPAERRANAAPSVLKTEAVTRSTCTSADGVNPFRRTGQALAQRAAVVDRSHGELLSAADGVSLRLHGRHGGAVGSQAAAWQPAGDAARARDRSGEPQGGL